MTTVETLPPRRLTDEEIRGALSMLMHAHAFAKQTLAQWTIRKKPPTKDELRKLLYGLADAEISIARLVRGPPSDGHALDELAQSFINWRKQL